MSAPMLTPAINPPSAPSLAKVAGPLPVFCSLTENRFLAAPISRLKTRWVAPDSAAFFLPSPIPTATSALSSNAPPTHSPTPSRKRKSSPAPAPNFPHSSAIDLILERYQQTVGRSAAARKEDKHLLAMAETTLEKMARGGVYDQLAGGFHRYSVDERWLVPHFEKMSYDNSELLKNYLHGTQLTENWLLAETSKGIIAWVNEVLSDQVNGGFYASQDADYSLDDDGDYFTWTLDELRAVLSPDESRVAELYYDVEPHGEMHHNPAKNVLWVAREFDEIAETTKTDLDTAMKLLLQANLKMLNARRARPTPFVDKTMYVSWNAMFVSAYLEASRVLEDSDYLGCREFALKTLDRMLNEVWTESRGFGHRIGGPALEGSLDDQVFSVLALLDAYETTLDPRYFSAAQKTMDLAIARYGDAEGGGFFDRPSDAAPMGGLDVRRKPFQDSPTPGANSVAAIALIRTHAFTGDDRYRSFAQKTLEAFAGIAPQYGLFAATYGLAATLFGHHPLQVVITGDSNDPAAQALEAAAHRVFRFGKSVLRVTPETPQLHLAGALKETLPHLPAGKPLAVVCSGQTCLPPTSDPEQLITLLENGIAGAATS